MFTDMNCGASSLKEPHSPPQESGGAVAAGITHRTTLGVLILELYLDWNEVVTESNYII